MPERLFLFIQMEFPWALGPPDGRYLLRASAGAEPERVVVLGTLGAARAGPRGLVPGRPGVLDRSRSRRRARAPATPEPAPVATTRATVVDPVSVAVERQARAWLADLDAAHEARAAVAVLNRVLHFHRIACADPYVHEVSGAQALVIRAGWGEGEQVADGLWLHAEELPPQADEAGAGGGRRRRGGNRSAALRPQERLAALLGARAATLLCEDLALHARLDLDQGRLLHAAIALDGAFAAALAELPAEKRQDLAIRIAELEQLRGQVGLQAKAALAAARLAAGDGAVGAETGARAVGTPGTAAPAPPADEPAGEPDEELIRNCLERLEAALRARTAPGFNLKR